MTHYDIFLCVIGALTALCFISLILIAVMRGGKGVRIAFCIVSALCLALSVFFELKYLGVIQIDIALPFIGGKKAVALIFSLAVISAGEFTFLLFYRDKAMNRAVCSNQEPTEVKHCVLVDNVRKAGERKHGDYVIKR